MRFIEVKKKVKSCVLNNQKFLGYGSCAMFKCSSLEKVEKCEIRILVPSKKNGEKVLFRFIVSKPQELCVLKTKKCS